MALFDPERYRGKRVCAALSGGADSVCLLHLLLCASEEYEIGLSAVHVEHGIRGEESLRDARFCEKLCKDWGIPLRIVRADVPKLAKETGMGLEEAAREARYSAFFDVLAAGEADLIATAHHLNDLAETVLFRLARGTSLSGIDPFAEDGRLTRPLLRVPRERILAYVAERGLPYAEDSTNRDERYTRNYVRRTVLPAFERIHGNAIAHLCEFAARCGRDDAYLSELARGEIVRRGEDRFVPVSLPEPLFSRACLFCMDAKRNYSAANLEEIFKLRGLQNGKKVSLPGGQEAAREGDFVVFYRPAPLPEERPFDESEWQSEGEEGLRADLDAFPPGCTVRTRREGDFIVPFGGKKKSLKKFLTDKKIPARIGNRLPLIAHGSEILAVVGVEISDKVCVTEGTKRIGRFGRDEKILGRN